MNARLTTPFPSNAVVDGSPTEQTEDKYVCRRCLCVGLANIIAGELSCAECDSFDVIELTAYQRQERAHRDAVLAQADREADERYEAQRKALAALAKAGA